VEGRLWKSGGGAVVVGDTLYNNTVGAGNLQRKDKR
jgi:hypothetical protein